MAKKYLVRNNKKGGMNMGAATLKVSSGTGTRGRRSTIKSVAATCSLTLDRDAAKKIKQAEENIQAGKTRSLRDIIRNG